MTYQQQITYQQKLSEFMRTPALWKSKFGRRWVTSVERLARTHALQKTIDLPSAPCCGS